MKACASARGGRIEIESLKRKVGTLYFGYYDDDEGFGGSFSDQGGSYDSSGSGGSYGAGAHVGHTANSFQPQGSYRLREDRQSSQIPSVDRIDEETREIPTQGYGQPTREIPQQRQERTQAYACAAQAREFGGQHYTSSSPDDDDREPVYRGPDRTDRPRRKRGSGKSFLMGLLGGVLAVAIAAGGFAAYNALANPGSDTVTVENADGTTSTLTINASGGDIELSEAVAAKALPSVVSIDVYKQAQSYSYNDLFGYGYPSGDDEQAELQKSSFGSGVIITSDGYIITNYHVVEGGAMYVVHFDDDSTAEATFVGGDGSSDIAVLKVEKEGLVPMDIGDSAALDVGEWVMTIGAPFGLTKSCSAGIVSALYRNETLNNSFGTSFYVNMVQIDANINPGNSGGALVNAQGQLVGITTMTTSYTGDFAGIGMAIPSNYAMNIANQIIETGEVHYSFVGVQLGTVDAGTRQYYGVSADSGAYVGRVIEGSPAEAAGVQVGDVIVSYNGKPVTTAAELIMDIRASNVGDTVELGIKRGDQDITLQATLALDTNEQTQQQ